MKLIKQLLLAILVALFFSEPADTQTVSVTIGEFASRVFVEWFGILDVIPPSPAGSADNVASIFASYPGETTAFAYPDYNCKL